jgi:magnesium transporter
MAARKRSKRWAKRRTPPGSTPGLLVPEPGAPPPAIRVTAFGPEEILDRRITEPEEIRGLVGRHPVVWVHVEGLGHPKTIEEIGALLEFHRLALADAVNVPQRPKGEEFEDTFFLLLRVPRASEGFELAQVSLFVREGLVVTFQSCSEEVFAQVRQRLALPRTRIRSMGSDYLAYALVDCVVDAYFPLLETCGDRIESLEREVIAGGATTLAATVHDMKHDLLLIRRVLWPLRDAITAFLRDDSPWLTKSARLHLRDAVDHVNQLLDLVETHLELATGLMTLHQSVLQQRSNEIMKVLTVLASIFIPLTFIVGVYGMNFDPDSSPWNMPELRWKWGYPAIMIFMLAITGIMLVYFRRKGWLGGGSKGAA